MISSFGLQEGLNQRSKQKTALRAMGFLVYDMQITLVQPHVSLIKLAFCFGRITDCFGVILLRSH